MTNVSGLVIAVLVVLAVPINADVYKRVCYYTNWSQYRPDPGKFTPAQIDPHLCSHIIIAFAKLEGTSLKPLEWNDEKTYKEINALKEINKDLKTMVAIGGWNAASTGFTNLVSSTRNRHAFINSAVRFLRKYDFNGLDLDWEYPTKRGGNKSDKENLVSLVEELKKRFQQEQEDFLLTAAVPVGKDNVDSGYDVGELAKYLDFINLMSYDIHGSWEKQTGENSPLYPRSSETGKQRYLNIEWASEYWVSKGTPRDKLIIGLATYGRSFTLQDRDRFGLGAPSTGPGRAGSYTREAGFLSYYEICSLQMSGGKTYRDREQSVPYYVKGNLWVGFDDKDSIRIKTEWLKQNGFGGAMIWSLALDDFNKLCTTSRTTYPLLTTINNVLNGGSDKTTTTVSTDTTSTGKTTTTTYTTTTTSATTTHHSSGEFSCRGRANGVYADPKSRHYFYMCSNGIAYRIPCPTGTLYDPTQRTCTWPWYVALLLDYLPHTRG